MEKVLSLASKSLFSCVLRIKWFSNVVLLILDLFKT